jgi:hypothetical protein
MIGYRAMFGFIFLFLTLVITISTAPIPDNQLISTKSLEETSTNIAITTTESVAYDDDDDSNESDDEDVESTTVDYPDETTLLPEVVTNGLLFTDTTEVYLDIDEIMKMTDRIFSETQIELPSTTTTTTTTESPETSDDDE